MLKLKTNQNFNVPSGRGVVSVVVRLIVENVFFDKNNVKVTGYYYYLNSDNQAIKLDEFGASSLVQRTSLEYLEENVLSQLVSTKSTFQNLEQRIKEMTLMQIAQEAPDNYGTTGTDWIEDND